jgi:hypothetical protein
VHRYTQNEKAERSSGPGSARNMYLLVKTLATIVLFFLIVLFCLI